MNKLSDYELEGGEWVKFHYHGWCEFYEYDFKDTYYFYTLNDKNSGKFGPNVLVESVLRPSVIVRDILDNTLRDLQNDNHISSYSQPYLVFNIIHPKQEAKSPEIEQALKDLDKLKVQGAHLIDKCTELERLIDKK